LFFAKIRDEEFGSFLLVPVVDVKVDTVLYESCLIFGTIYIEDFSLLG